MNSLYFNKVIAHGMCPNLEQLLPPSRASMYTATAIIHHNASSTTNASHYPPPDRCQSSDASGGIPVSQENPSGLC